MVKIIGKLVNWELEPLDNRRYPASWIIVNILTLGLLYVLSIAIICVTYVFTENNE